MRDLVAALIAFALLVVAASLATTLHFWRKKRVRAHDSERALGRTIIAEIPTDDELKLFSEDPVRFYYDDQPIDKDLIAATRVLINGTPIAAVVAHQYAREAERHPTSFEDRPEGIARDRWDVAIETVTGTIIVECGAIRERISQELARSVFAAVKREVERRNAA
jgi:hypothetical protein